MKQPLRPGWGAREWFDEGVLRMQQQAYKEALFAFHAALEFDPRSLAVQSNVGYCLLDLGRVEEATDVFQQILRDEPDHLDARFGQALAVEKAGQPSRALELWKDYVREAPESRWKEKARRHIERLNSR